MFWSAKKKDKERQRYYLLAGMGKGAMRRKRRTIRNWTLAAALLFSFLVACLLYLMYLLQLR